ncbi:MAG TPA: serine/threonine-protein kinase [Phycisphaerae bacterium]
MPDETTQPDGSEARRIRAAADDARIPSLPTEDLIVVPGAVPLLTIPGYEILRELHRGGQGIVYQAVQKSTKRKVAVKLLLEGPFASASTKRRFEREVDLVAQLKHPNIITIFDSGMTADGRLFFAMDYVRGVPLRDYVRDNKLTLEQTLKLFGQVCEAVQYAHQKGVIHRDLKPSNILVDSDGAPKVLDFGLAKQMAAPVDTVMSMTGHVLGTLPYMSPEQARGNPDHIDTRTDVYALGVILYELLTGHYPYPVVGVVDEVLRHIKDTPPTPPSRAWHSDSGVGGRSARKLRPGQCPIDEEVQTIVLKALSKERERRYQSAGDLARDVARYLNDEPIEARRASALYLIRALMRRHRSRVFGALAIVLATGGSLLYAQWRVSQARTTRLAEYQRRFRAEERERAALDTAAAVMIGLQAFGTGPEAKLRVVRAAELLKTANESVPESVAVATLRSQFLGLYQPQVKPAEREAILRGVSARGKPELAEYWNELADVSIAQHKWVEAASANTEILRLDPRHPFGLSRAGLLRIASDDYTGAQVAATALVEAYPANSEGWLVLAYSLQKQMRCDDVVSLLSAYFKRPHPEARLHAELSGLKSHATTKNLPHWALGHWALARAILARPALADAEYRRVLSLTPTFNVATHDIVNWEHVEAEWRSAFQAPAIRTDSGDLIVLGPGEGGRAPSLFMVQRPGDTFSPTTWCLVQLRLGNLEIAIAGFRRSLRFQGEDAADYLLLSIALERHAEVSEAKKAFENGIALLGDRTADAELLAFRDEAWATLRVGSLSRRLGKKEEVARHILEEPEIGERTGQLALRILEDYGDLARDELRGVPLRRLNERAWQVVRAPSNSPEQYIAALNDARSASLRMPQDAATTNTLGVALYRAERFDEAIAALRKSEARYARALGIDATPLPPQQPANWAFIAMAHHHLGHLDEARAAFEKLRTLMKEPRNANNEESRQFLQEAELLLAGGHAVDDAAGGQSGPESRP